MEKSTKKILLLSIFGGAAVLIAVGYFAFLLWALAKAFPNSDFKEVAIRFKDYVIECSGDLSDRERNEKCLTEWLLTQKNDTLNKKREENPEYNACMYQQEVLLEALAASKLQGEEQLQQYISQYCDYQQNPSPGLENTTTYAGYTALKLLKNELASQAILNYRYSQYKKKNYLLETEALTVYHDLANAARSCEDMEAEMLALQKRGSVFVLGSLAICKLQKCRNSRLDHCPETVKLAQQMHLHNDIASDFILMHEAALADSSPDNEKVIQHARLALESGYTDVAGDFDSIQEDFYKIKFTKDSLAFSAARLANAAKIYAPALNCIAASLNKDWEFETLLKSPQTFTSEQWIEKINGWAGDNSELLVRLACEVLTDIDSKIRLHEYFMNDGFEDGSEFEACKVIQDPLFKDFCETVPETTNKETTERD